MMNGRKLHMIWKTPAGSFILAALLILCSYSFLDMRLALFVCQKVGRPFLLSTEVSNAPDLLFEISITLTVLSWAAYIFSVRRKPPTEKSDFFELVGCAVPISFLLKQLLKFVVGRTDTRVWLMNPDLYGFHWFHGGPGFSGFPSGHMVVFTSLLLAVCRFHPRLRYACVGLLVLLAAALIITEYHFLSDVIAGAYAGLVVELVVYRSLLWLHGPRTGHEAG